MHGEPRPCAIIAIYSLLRATPINLLLLQKIYSCSMPGNIHVQQTYSLYETTSTYTSHVFVSASLWVATPTNPSRYLFAYREYTLLGTCNALLTQFLSVFHSLPIRVTSGSYPGLTRIAIRVIRVSSCDPVSTLLILQATSERSEAPEEKICFSQSRNES